MQIFLFPANQYWAVLSQGQSCAVIASLEQTERPAKEPQCLAIIWLSLSTIHIAHIKKMKKLKLGNIS
jgi:hypothetical protein